MTCGDDRRRAEASLRLLNKQQRDDLAVALLEVYLAEQKSLGSVYHREHVYGVLGGLAPSMARALRSALKIARRSCA